MKVIRWKKWTCGTSSVSIRSDVIFLFAGYWIKPVPEITMSDRLGDRIQVAATVEQLSEEQTKPCMFCSSMEHEGLIIERGFIEADYQLVTTYGDVLGYTCEMCISEAPSPTF